MSRNAQIVALATTLSGGIIGAIMNTIVAGFILDTLREIYIEIAQNTGVETTLPVLDLPQFLIVGLLFGIIIGGLVGLGRFVFPWLVTRHFIRSRDIAGSKRSNYSGQDIGTYHDQFGRY